MLDKGIDYKMVADCTGLNLFTVRDLKEKIKNEENLEQ